MKIALFSLIRVLRPVLVAGLLCVSGALHAQDQKGPHFRFYGHFSPTILGVNDGVDFYGNAADNSNSGGRIGAWFTNPIGESTLKFNLELGLGIRQSASISQIYEPPLLDFDGQSLRKAEVILETPRWGKLLCFIEEGDGSSATLQNAGRSQGRNLRIH